MMDFSTAGGAYGFVHGGTPVGSVMAETSVGADFDLPFTGESLGLGTSNPLFWLLILFLVFTGWIFGAFDFGIKRVGSLSVKAGK
jgi:hypothetical protein